jgi:hypothetical protein
MPHLSRQLPDQPQPPRWQQPYDRPNRAAIPVAAALAPRRPNVDDQKVETAAGPLSQANSHNAYFRKSLLNQPLNGNALTFSPNTPQHPHRVHSTTFILFYFYFIWRVMIDGTSEKTLLQFFFSTKSNSCNRN